MRVRNVKKPKADGMVTELAAISGETLMSAFENAPARALGGELTEQRGGGTVAAILAFAAKFAPGMTDGSSSVAHANLLYGDDGMPV